MRGRYDNIRDLPYERVEELERSCEEYWGSEKYSDPKYWLCRAVILEYRRRLLESLLNKPSENSLIALAKKLWGFEVFRDVEQAVKRRVLSRMGVADVVKRIMELLKSGDIESVKIPGFGPSIKSEILFIYDPERYPIMNKRSIEIMKLLLNREARTYNEFKELLEPIVKKLEREREIIAKEVLSKVKEGYGIEIKLPKYEFIDGIIHLLYESRRGRDVGITIERFKMFLNGELDSLLLGYVYKLEVPESIIKKIRRLTALEEAVSGRRPTATEVLRKALDLYQKKLVEELKTV